ncbi:MAG: sterol desaturase family protein [Nitrospira sp.]|nr:sterol desaturase family protein [Nitrospira sp.]
MACTSGLLSSGAPAGCGSPYHVPGLLRLCRTTDGSDPLSSLLLLALAGISFGFKLVVFLLVLDGIAYWMHRLWHTSWGWPIHRWHHAPTKLYWLAGVRASFPQIVLSNVPLSVGLSAAQTGALTVLSALFLYVGPNQ